MKALYILAFVGLLMLTYGCVSTGPQPAPQTCNCSCPGQNGSISPAPTQNPLGAPVICNCPNCPVNPAQASGTDASTNTSPATNVSSPAGTLPATPPVQTTRSGLTQAMCESGGGHWNGCGSVCRGDPPDAACPTVCMAYCECGGGYGCPDGYQCGNYLPIGSNGSVAGAIGICQNNNQS